MRIIFFGNDDFALEGLKSILDSRHQVVGCVTRPDRPSGRHLIIEASAVKQTAVARRIPVFQPADCREPAFIQELHPLKPDVIVVIAYGQYIPRSIRELPRTLCINVHASLLPKYRGAAPVNWAIVNGEEKTGVSIMEVAARMDAGDILAQEEEAILPDDTAVSLRARLARRGAGLLVRTLDSIARNDYALVKQDEKKVSYAPKLSKQDGLIDWGCDAVFIHNMVRGMQPWPGAFTTIGRKTLKVVETKVADKSRRETAPGSVVSANARGIDVATGKGVLRLLKVHPESSREMDAAAFVAGHTIQPGQRLGD